MIDLLMFLHSLISAGTYLAAKRALVELSPFELATARFLLAGAIYAALLLRQPPRIARRDFVGLVALGFVAIPLNQGLFLGGLSLTTPDHAALLYGLTPVFVFLFALLRGEERSSALKVTGITVAFTGAVIVLLSQGRLAGVAQPRKGLAGDVLVLAAVVAWAVYVAWGKPYAERYGAVATTGLTVVTGTFLYLPLGMAFTRGADFRVLSPVGWASLAYLVLLTSVVAYLIYYYALAREDASRVAIWSNTQPVLTAILAWAMYGERFTPAFLGGGALVIAGVALTQRG
ncbi:MAG TPA: DMT family transporter [Anaeromyxobacteraceae bacterium]|nr:DMT family transporter [Anaeromyxobacteraceae bacterium]